jgi:putative cell wall-binding protein
MKTKLIVCSTWIYEYSILTLIAQKNRMYIYISTEINFLNKASDHERVDLYNHPYSNYYHKEVMRAFYILRKECQLAIN